MRVEELVPRLESIGSNAVPDDELGDDDDQAGGPRAPDDPEPPGLF
jgi:hypothetical protein